MLSSLNLHGLIVSQLRLGTSSAVTFLCGSQVVSTVASDDCWREDTCFPHCGFAISGLTGGPLGALVLQKLDAGGQSCCIYSLQAGRPWIKDWKGRRRAGEGRPLDRQAPGDRSYIIISEHARAVGLRNG